MNKLIIQEVNDYDYTARSEKGIIYRLNIEFYSGYKPQVNDIIYLNDDILKEANLYAFEEIHDIKNIQMKDIIKVISKNKKYYFKRVYG